MNIFVFGSNLAGRHAAGAALYAARHHGAIYGQGVGLQGSSYALPTKDENIKTLDLDRIDEYILEFISHATAFPDNTYLLTPVGTGLAGYSRAEIMELIMKYEVPKNVVFTKEWFNL